MKNFLQIKNISKSYKLGETNILSFVEDIKIFLNKDYKKKNVKLILDNCSLSLKKGDSVAILGKNGAGKSTLLKIISKITYPDKGHVIYEGTIASMLSIVNSLEQDFTGEENIFFLGSGMGFSKNEIKKKLNKILEFSEIGAFKDTPIKRFSTGMRVRLSFSICLNLNCDIILADEVLTVADMYFQKKCIKFLKEIIKKKSKIILFVSHDRSLNLNICKKGIILNKGNLSKQYNIKKAYKIYDSLK
ncbi:ABC transporter ATP-binding protein [Candidatus Pelagibacter bacterium]|jgi:lipopolysaccharide transport system ATP-binding protein|nr:ABC transporter ATP-binding protein [Candidatus Pelagibacter bacterium]MDB2709293.1 ABC transporter ATP-binding protein [Candidatus Pelagibacter bacterium]